MPANLIDAAATATELRQTIRARRRALDDRIQLQHSQLVRRKISAERSYKNARHIGCYLANDGEIDPYPLIEHAWFLNKTVYLPVLSPLKDQLYFAPYKNSSRLKLNRFNIAEPSCHPAQWKTAAQLDLLLLPLVAFDRSGNRMGMGGGFYDRTLAYLQHRKLWKKPVLIGLAHELQRVEKLHTQNWDIPVNLIITERQRYTAA